MRRNKRRLATSLLLMVVVICLSFPISAFAYNGGYLQGVTGYFTGGTMKPGDTTGTPTTELTDYPGSGLLDGGTTNGYYSYTLAEPKQIDSVYINNSGAVHTIYFYDSNKTLLGKVSNPYMQKGMFPTDSMYDDVKYVIYQKSGGINTAYEFDIYGPTVVPIAPTGLTATSGTKSVTLSWAKQLHTGTYNVYLNGQLFKSGITGTSYTVTGLTNGTSYTFKVSGTNIIGEGPQSSAVNSTPNGPPPPQPPTNLVAVSGIEKITLNWLPSSNTVAGYDIYTVSGTKVNTTLITGTTYEYQLKPGTYESFYVVAYDSVNDQYSTQSNTVSGYSYLLVTKPVVKVSDISYDSLTLSWKISGNSYEVFQDGVSLGTTNGNEFKLKNLAPETNYTFAVTAYGDLNQVQVSEPVTVKTIKIPDPLIPTISTIFVKEKSARIVWNNTSGPYTVLINGEEVGKTDVNYFEFNSLKPNTSYIVNVSYVDTFGRTIKSNDFTLKTPLPPGQVPTPPPVSNSSNPNLNHANDYLVQGPKDLGKNFMSLILAIIALLILVFGVGFLMKIFKKKTNKTASRKSTGKTERPVQPGSASRLNLSSTDRMDRLQNSQRLSANIAHNHKNQAQKAQRRMKYYVQKNRF